MYKRVAAIRHKFGLTQQEFADSLSISKSSIGLIEIGKRNLTEKNMRLICATYGISLEWLKTGEGNMMVQQDDDLQIIERMLKSDDKELKTLVIKICKMSIAEREKMKELIENLNWIFNS